MDMKDGYISCKRPAQPDVDRFTSVSIPQGIRKRALNAIHTLDYVPDQSGSGLRLRKNSIIAALFHVSTIRLRLLIKRVPHPTGAFAANDLIAMGALAALRDTGLRVPDDIAVVGFDDIPAAKLVSPSLTTISQFPEQLGRRAAEMLFERLEGTVTGGGRCELMPHELIVREST